MPNNSIAIAFQTQDQPYFNWMDENPNGLVLNTTRSPGAKYAMVHRSNCYHIRTVAEHWEENAYTAYEYIKVCSNDAEGLMNWIQQNRKHVLDHLRICKSCQPEIQTWKAEAVYPDEIPVGIKYTEGAVKKVTVNAYERDAAARKKCLEIYGHDCSVCGMNFADVYGTEIGESFIHVHHLKPLSQIGEAYQVDPRNDLRPVCPNCHAMLHKNDPPFEIEELKNRLQQKRSKFG